ncbi:MAG: hypothetical protein WA857_03125 [Candidatus Acidiferrum sp.]
MTTRIWLRLAEILVPIILAITIFVSWQADRRDRAQLATQLATAQKTIAEATASQHDRDTLLNQTLAQLASQKQAAVTTAQILKDLPAALSLPSPITLQGAPPATAATNPATSQAAKTSSQTSPNSSAAVPATLPSTASSGKLTQAAPLPTNPAPSQSNPAPANAPDAVIPAADLKPLYDFALDCKACQAKLAAVQSDLSDEKTITAALTKQRDEAVTAAKGGTVLHRILRAAKWFVLGTAAGGLAARLAH